MDSSFLDELKGLALAADAVVAELAWNQRVTGLLATEF